MEIKPPANALYAAISKIAPASLENIVNTPPPPNWKVSQLLKAVITQITDKQLFLNIEGIKANTLKPATLDLHIGDTLELKIEKLKPMPQFQIIRSLPKASVDLTNHLVKNTISPDSSIAPLLKNIGFIANRPALSPSPLPAETNAAVRDLFKNIPTVFNLKTAPQIKNHLENSGLFIESKIRKQIISAIQHSQITKLSNNNVKVNIKPLLQLDLGAQLHRIATLIRTQLSETKSTPLQTTPPTSSNKIIPQQQNPVQTTRVAIEQTSIQNIMQREEAMQTFLRQVESSLTHLQQTQLQNLNESQAGRPLWLMELPVKNGPDVDLFELRISEDESSQTDNEDKKIWNVTLNFNLSGLGKVKAHITMQNEIVSAQFYSEKPEVLGLFRENFDILRNRLNYNGLNVGNIECARANLSNIDPAHNDASLDKTHE